MAPPKQKAASYELIETGGGEGYGSVEPASADSTNEEYDKYDGGETPRRKLLSLVAPASATGKFLPPGAGGGRAGRGAPRGGVSYSFGHSSWKIRGVCGRRARVAVRFSSDQFASGQ